MFRQTLNIRGHTILNRLKADSVVLDCGGNHGDFSKIVSERFGSRVIAVEPNPKLFAAFPASSRIKALPYALAGHNGEMEFRIGEDDEASSLIGTPQSQQTAIAVPVRTLESIMAEAGVDSVDLVKMDIEGAEIPVLMETPEAVLKKIGQITVEFHDFCNYVSVEQVEAALARMRQLGFRICRMTTHAHGDVLMVNRQRGNLSLLGYGWIMVVEKNARGLQRILRRVLGRFG
jgi:FkbM family methyltransferase